MLGQPVVLALRVAPERARRRFYRAADCFSVLLEPWVALFCLAAAVMVFHGDRLADSRRRLVWGGVTFGFAGKDAERVDYEDYH